MGRWHLSKTLVLRLCLITDTRVTEKSIEHAQMRRKGRGLGRGQTDLSSAAPGSSVFHSNQSTRFSECVVGKDICDTHDGKCKTKRLMQMRQTQRVSYRKRSVKVRICQRLLRPKYGVDVWGEGLPYLVVT